MPATDDDVLLALSPLGEDQTLGRYELLVPIGRGGMAVVWAARQRGSRGFSKLVAVKTMLPQLSADPRFERMFLAEAELASRIEHPNVCRVLDLGDDHGVVYLVMDLVAGESLATAMSACRAAGTRVPPDIAAAIIAQAARGLHAAHELKDERGDRYGIVHRDVSPQNVLVTWDGAAIIVDFGVAKAAERSEQVTESGFIKGKVAYLAPEQVHGRKLDARTDVFALGVVLYEMSTGVHPFRGAADVTTLLHLSSPDPAESPERVIREYPPELAAIVKRAIDKDPDARFPTMADFAAELDAHASPPEVVATWIGALLENERARRVTLLDEATRAADARERRRAREPRPAPKRGEGERGRDIAAPAGRGRRTVMTAVTAAVGIMGGVALGVSVAGRSPAPEKSAVREPAPPPAAPPLLASAPTTSVPPVTVTTPIDPPLAPAAEERPGPGRPARTTPSGRKAPGQAAPPPQAADVAAPTPPAASSGPRFRDPGF